jgi:hypothetical protein
MADEWMEGTGADALEGSDDANTIDDKVTASLQNPLDRLLAMYRRAARIAYASASSVTISAGEVTCSNTLDTVHRMRRNTAAVTLSFPTDLDTGSEAANTTYYVYAVADADATTFTGVISASATAPTGVTYYQNLGSFKNNASSNIDVYTVVNETTTLAYIKYYSTSGTTGTSISPSDLKICSGIRTVAGSSTATVTGLPFTSATSYVALVCHGDASESNASENNVNIDRYSGSQITIYNRSTGTTYAAWIAIGT